MDVKHHVYLLTPFCLLAILDSAFPSFLTYLQYWLIESSAWPIQDLSHPSHKDSYLSWLCGLRGSLIDWWLLIIYNYIYILFSALLSWLTALACGSTWVTSFFYIMFSEYSLKWCTYALQRWHGWCHMKLQPSQHKFCVHHTTMHYVSCHFMQSHIRTVYACLAVTCHLHFWQNDRDLLSFMCYCSNTGGEMDIEIRGSTESRPWRKTFSSPTIPAGIQTHDLSFSITSLAF